MKLKWLEIERFRNVAPGTRLEFDDGFNVVLGRNGTGKTTLLRLLAAVASGRFMGFEGESFAVNGLFVVRGEEVRVRMAQSPHQRNASTRAPNALLDYATDDWQFDMSLRGLHVAATPSKTKILVGKDEHELPALKPFAVRPFGDVMLRLWSLQNKRSTPLLRFAQESYYNLRFDEATGVFNKLTGSPSEVVELEQPYVVQMGKDGPMVIHGHCPATRVPRKYARGVRADAPYLSFSRRDLPFLDAVSTLLEADVSLQFSRGTVSVLPRYRSARYERPIFQITFPNGVGVSHEHLSYGQKRLLSFAYHLETCSGPLIADELVNGMHHAWIENCLERIQKQRKQAFLTSQNPLLLDYLEFESAEEAQRAFVLCELDGDTFVWRQMSDDEARRFYSAYEVGVQHVGDILRTKGLW